MPDPGLKGDLEALLWQAVDASDHRACVDDFITCLDTCNPVPFGAMTKARLYSWLSTQREPLKELHTAFKSTGGVFDPAHPAFNRFSVLIDTM